MEGSLERSLKTFVQKRLCQEDSAEAPAVQNKGTVYYCMVNHGGLKTLTGYPGEGGCGA